ncbi:Cytochrome P450-like protein 63 [Elsinoe fawcettii]|nr:Cytochrome P450-like protein 63 [Elsinoe fawcettii]
MLWLLTLVVGVSFILQLLQSTYVALLGPLRKIPGPFISKWTNLVLKYHTLAGTRMQYIHSLHERYGSVVRSSPTEVAVNDADAVRTIQCTAGGFDKAPWYDLTGPGLIGMRDRTKHSQRRRLLAHALSNSYLTNFEPLVRAKVDLVVQKMRDEYNHRGNTDVFKWFSLMATDIIGDLTFGSSFQMIEQGKKTEYVHDLEMVMPSMHKRIELYPLLDLAAWLPLKTAREVSQRFKRIFGYGKESMWRLQLAVRSGELTSPVFFSTALGKDGKPGLSQEELEQEAAEFMITGTDTTSDTLTYLVWAVLCQPKVQARLQGELKSLPEEKPCVCTARLLSPHPRSVSTASLSVKGLVIPSGTVVTTQAYSLHRLPNVWREPDIFSPERWLEATEGLRESFIPFGSGPRICIGIHLAYMELRMTTAAFFRAFTDAELHPDMTDHDMDIESYTLIVPKGRKCLVKVA